MNEQMEPPAPMPAPPSGFEQPKGMAIASMVLGIVSLALFCVWYVTIPCAVVGLILGIIAGGKAKRGEGGGAGMAKAGVIMSIIAMAVVVLIIILAIVGIAVLGPKLQEMDLEMRNQQNGPSGSLGTPIGSVLALIHDQARFGVLVVRASLGC